ncbi:MAG TPA: glycerate kinase [Coriobacteriia bacterium]|nr:glycerate kinase [Coriobacteriia bacterium]
MTRIVIAPDKFKGSLSAAEVAEAIRRGLLNYRSDLDILCLPIADGGDGTLAAVEAAGFERVLQTATGPTGEPVMTAYGRRGDTAVVEMADVSGLVRLPEGELASLTATSRGLGELIAGALSAGARRIVVGIGGSACTDGGAGMLQALGVSLRDGDGNELGVGGAALLDLAEVDLSGVHPAVADAEVVVACDVDNPLTGPLGAAAVYGPQKGATEADVHVLDAGLTRLADHLAGQTGRDVRDVPGAGAAGGAGFAALALFGATLRPGIDLILELVEFAEHVVGADLVIVGEGSMDAQTLHGKAPMGVARMAGEVGATVIAVCGRSTLDEAQLREVGVAAAYALADIEPDVDRSMTNAATLLELVAEKLAREHLSQQ